MRIFIGLSLPKEVKDHLYDIQQSFKKNNAKIRWISKKNLHITLKFIGELPEDKINELKNKLREVRFSPIELTLTHLGVFPDFKKIKVLWAGLTQKEDINKLQVAIDSETLEFSNDNDVTYTSHITLGRVKDIKDIKNLVDQIKSTKIDKIKFGINSFVLYKANLTKDGSNYEVLEEFSS